LRPLLQALDDGSEVLGLYAVQVDFQRLPSGGGASGDGPLAHAPFLARRHRAASPRARLEQVLPLVAADDGGDVLGVDAVEVQMHGRPFDRLLGLWKRPGGLHPN